MLHTIPLKDNMSYNLKLKKSHKILIYKAKNWRCCVIRSNIVYFDLSNRKFIKSKIISFQMNYATSKNFLKKNLINPNLSLYSVMLMIFVKNMIISMGPKIL